ncbi:MAG: GNAT family N-acetyltransferase [Pirellulaceae bacterium]|nr:GNAT family N-acetyltransferase [Pirellulaceae bacterium]
MLPADPTRDNRNETGPLSIRAAQASDVPAITRIFNHAIAHTTASFYEQSRTIEQRTHWFTQRDPRNAVWVAACGPNVVGWVALDAWSEKQGYLITTEISYYVAADFRGRGIGSQLVAKSIEVARQNQFRNILAKICENNLVSIRLAERLGFQHRGTLKSVGQKFDQTFDVHFYQKQL